jgi:hypothetical protein
MILQSIDASWTGRRIRMTDYRSDPKTGEIVLRWSHYDPITEQEIWFSRRFHPSAYVTDDQLRREYHFTAAQYQALGGYDEMTSQLNRWGYVHATYWWKRERVEAIITAKSGSQAELF